jgi:hypothetical protein
MSTPAPLEIFVQCLKKVPDPRSKQGVSQPFQTILAVVFLGLIARVSTIAEIERWVGIHCAQLKPCLEFRKTGVPSDSTMTRVLRKLSLADLQAAFAEFIRGILTETPIVAAVDGKAAKQMKDEDGNPILMLNVFAQTLKLHLASWSVKGDKTNEPGCLMKHLEELFEMYPCLKLLTGDAIYAQRPLLGAIQEYHRDYLVQIKENQGRVFEQMELTFADAPEQQEPAHQTVGKKRGALRFAACG